MSCDELLVSCEAAIGHIRLNRPKAVNALTFGMIVAFADALDAFAASPEIIAVLATGEGDRGLCAGGDIRALYELKDKDKEPYKEFWRREYRLNARIASYPKPYIAIMDGVVMGGGVGISAHGNRRIVTERTRLAMPETSIGFIPDVGGTWLLSRRGGAGVYMALAGIAVGAADAIYVGLADMAIESRNLARLAREIHNARSVREIDALLRDLRWTPPQGELERNKAVLDAAMARDTIEETLSCLRADASEFAKTAADEIEQRSPLALKVTHALLARARSADRLESCLLNEYRAGCALLHSHDLYEGIRAAIIDKDRRPRWSPPTLAAVGAPAVAAIVDSEVEREPAFTA